MQHNIENLERELQLLLAQVDMIEDPTLKHGFLNAARECNIRIHQMNFFAVVNQSRGGK